VTETPGTFFAAQYNVIVFEVSLVESVGLVSANDLAMAAT
jgi:hypothetical protein